MTNFDNRERTIDELDVLSKAHHFYSIDATRPLEENADALSSHVSKLLQAGHGAGVPPPSPPPPA